MTLEEVKTYLSTIGFSVVSHTATYENNSGYSITVHLDPENPQNSQIDYGSQITVHDKRISNLKKPENFVVLQCVVSLLAHGYAPNNIELEKKWTLGHNESGKLDVLLRSADGNKVFAMIECKTWGREYDKARRRLLDDGGQLFSYFNQDRSAKFLYLYGAKFETNQVATRIEYLTTAKLKGDNAVEFFSSWSGSLQADGIFKVGIAPYDDKALAPLRRDALRDLDKDTGVGVFHEFAEILRRHVVSDKPNAFNKIFNLFLAKLADEDIQDGSGIADFQWLPSDTSSSFLTRIEQLYARGLENYLGITGDTKFQNLSSEFSFIDVFNKDTYERNIAILREVVQLLQPYKLRYAERHQYLGDFFEMLLNVGVKQEVGQYFTPVPLAEAILHCLPISDLIKDKAAAKQTRILPYVIDFACGAGHFLTEAISYIDAVARSVVPSLNLTRAAQQKYRAEENGLLWAGEYIYGVEKDYRLAKVTKIATFLNGDGDANIIQGDGLAPFQSGSGYTGRLLAGRDGEAPHSFDVLVANPPFAVSSFRRELAQPFTLDSNTGKTMSRFRLYKYLTGTSGEIECLFLERAAELLTDHGIAAIIFPLSMLNNKRAIYQAARRLLGINFEICGMLELGDKTFFETPTTTVCLFLRKRSKEDIELAAAQLLRNQDTCDSKIVDYFKEANVSSVATVVQLAYDVPEIFNALRKVLDSAESTIISSTGSTTREQERILGYRFSKRRGGEGCNPVRDKEGAWETLLLDPSNKDASDRIATQIRFCFEGQPIKIPNTAQTYLRKVSTEAIWTPDGTIANPSGFLMVQDIVSVAPLGDIFDNIPYTTVTLGNWLENGKCAIIKGATYNKREAETPTPTSIRIITATNLDIKSRTIDLTKSLRYLRDADYVSPAQQPRIGDIVINLSSGSLNHVGKFAIPNVDVAAYIGGFLAIIRCKNIRDRQILETNLLSKSFREWIYTLREQNISNLTDEKLRTMKIKVPENLSEFQKLYKSLVSG